MEQIKSKDIVCNCSFVLYDENDIIMCYFDNYYELSQYINIPSWNLAIRFNKNRSNIINIFIDGVLRRLYVFEKEKIEE